MIDVAFVAASRALFLTTLRRTTGATARLAPLGDGLLERFAPVPVFASRLSIFPPTFARRRCRWRC